ncbi:superoxide dismutase family protein [Sphingopyxis sp.]|uniref:superoxide dismutase family protein n=1 Tax=Sphingopyxis sp. TaxID=1908224 RepID=UPI002B46FF16|nr:superoxide dismutase family protein [Sphingopyxis sp.]
MNRICWTMVGLPVLLAGCNPPDASTPPAQDDNTAAEEAAPTAAGPMPTEYAMADLKAADGKPVGKATASVDNGRVMLSLQVEGLPPGDHGVHVHMTGKCDAPKFESAGAHWNPANAQHGLEAPAGQHAGDMPNLVVDANGLGRLTYELKGATFAGLMDADESAMVVHASADDQKTDPSGNSGDRIACGIFNVGQAVRTPKG